MACAQCCRQVELSADTALAQQRIPDWAHVHDHHAGTQTSSAVLQGGAAAGLAALYFGLGLSSEQLGGLLVAVVFTYFADQVTDIAASACHCDLRNPHGSALVVCNSKCAAGLGEQRLPVQIANGGGVQNLALDSAARVINREYSERVALHEAGEQGAVLCLLMSSRRSDRG